MFLITQIIHFVLYKRLLLLHVSWLLLTRKAVILHTTQGIRISFQRLNECGCCSCLIKHFDCVMSFVNKTNSSNKKIGCGWVEGPLGCSQQIGKVFPKWVLTPITFLNNRLSIYHWPCVYNAPDSVLFWYGCGCVWVGGWSQSFLFTKSPNIYPWTIYLQTRTRVYCSKSMLKIN